MGFWPFVGLALQTFSCWRIDFEIQIWQDGPRTNGRFTTTFQSPPSPSLEVMTGHSLCISLESILKKHVHQIMHILKCFDTFDRGFSTANKLFALGQFLKVLHGDKIL